MTNALHQVLNEISKQLRREEDGRGHDEGGRQALRGGSDGSVRVLDRTTHVNGHRIHVLLQYM